MRSSIRRVVCPSSFLFFMLCIQATPSLCAPWRRCALSEHTFFMMHNPFKQKNSGEETVVTSRPRLLRHEGPSKEMARDVFLPNTGPSRTTTDQLYADA
ncbi:hypothetical protein BGW80DRAFT_1307835 [Lactifluus volemus]|nr:hypothetical protein BGW80DRAFT_1307835 [Lactifluus volemus]